jgi:hypothetical protein
VGQAAWVCPGSGVQRGSGVVVGRRVAVGVGVDVGSPTLWTVVAVGVRVPPGIVTVTG